MKIRGLPDEKTAPRTAQENIEAILAVEEEFARERSPIERFADVIASFVGTVPFVLVQLALMGGWLLYNSHPLTAHAAFDPYPFPILGIVVSIESVLLTALVLIKQNGMSQRAEHRSHLDLQVNLLSEKEITKVMQMQRLICRRLGITEPEADEEVHELSENTAVESLARELKEKIPEF